MVPAAALLDERRFVAARQPWLKEKRCGCSSSFQLMLHRARRSGLLDNDAVCHSDACDSMTRGRHTERCTLMRCWLGGIGLCLLLSSATTWIGAIHDHPASAGVVAGMNASECGRVSAMPAGSLLTMPLPELDICLPLFVYRASYPDAASDVATYRTWIFEQRVREFWQFFGYVLLLWATILGLIVGSILVVRYRAGDRHREPRSRATDDYRAGHDS